MQAGSGKQEGPSGSGGSLYDVLLQGEAIVELIFNLLSTFLTEGRDVGSTAVTRLNILLVEHKWHPKQS